MKAFTLYSPGELELRKLKRKLEEHGTVNCDFDMFSKLYEKWKQRSYPGTKITPNSVIIRCEMFMDFIDFLQHEDI